MGNQEEQLDRIYREYGKTVYKYLYSLTMNADTAEELTAETFYQAVKSISSYNGTCKLSVWLCQIGKHLWYQELERRKKYQKVGLDTIQDLADDSFCPSRKLAEQNDKIQLYKLLHNLDEQTREVMYMRLMGDLSYREIGAVLGKSENWARVTFYRGKAKIMKRRNQDEDTL